MDSHVSHACEKRANDPQEYRQRVVGQPEDWLRLDELFFRVWFSGWLATGKTFAPAPGPAAVARQLAISMEEYKSALERLREELARPTDEDCPPRVDLWLGDPPRDEAGALAPRLWLSGRAHRQPASEAAKLGLLPAASGAQAQQSRAAIYGRWLARDDDALDQSAEDDLPLELTQCRGCGAWLDVRGDPGVRLVS